MNLLRYSIVHLWISGHSACGEGIERPGERGPAVALERRLARITCLNCRATEMFAALADLTGGDPA